MAAVPQCPKGQGNGQVAHWPNIPQRPRAADLLLSEALPMSVHAQQGHTGITRIKFRFIYAGLALD
jgi:hypothetical protein